MTSRRLICVHGHFYQPPRENPWLEEVEVQDSASPFHDWNERIAAECYGPNGAARVKRHDGRITDIVNNYRHISFDFGATLLSWLERHARWSYSVILEADAQSRAQRGFGNAMACAFSHAILPLATPRDRVTQIRWGIADFRHRFGRDPEGFWCSETAVDGDTLRALADEGIQFTVLSPLQAHRVRPVAQGGAAAEWQDARGGQFDPTRPYRIDLGNGRKLALLFYDAPIARQFAFDGGLTSNAIVHLLEGGFDASRDHVELLSVAVDGETFGHHKKGGDEALASAVKELDAREDLQLVNYAQALALCPPEWEAEVIDPSSWSCMHGVERWRSDCGCEANGQPGWKQAWRAPLRAALDQLRDRLWTVFEQEGSRLFEDPGRARDDSIDLVLDPDRRQAAEFLTRHAGRTLFPEEEVTALQLLEMERQAQLMYASCGWFFSEISGLETVQILKYAARALQLAREAAGVDLEPQFKEWLAAAPSNISDFGDGQRVYEMLVLPSVVSLEGVAAHHVIASLFDEQASCEGRIFYHRYRIPERRRETSGAATLAVGRLQIESLATREWLDLSFCALHFGGSDIRCGLRPFVGAADQVELEQALFSRLERLSLAQVVREIDRAFPGRDYSLRDLFLDGRRRLTRLLLAETLRRTERDYVRIFEENLRLMSFLREIDSPIPIPLRVAADVGLTRDLESTLATLDGGASLATVRADAQRLIDLAGALGARLDLAGVSAELHRRVDETVDKLLANGSRRETIELIELVDLAHHIGLAVDLWSTQNRIWEWMRSPSCHLEHDLLRRLANRLFFDEAASVERASAPVDEAEEKAS